MSKVVTIPKDRNPFVVIVNGVKYSYPAGVSTEVPDEVADVIEKYVGAKPKPDPNAGINFGGAQSDWNQTDSSAADFIKNKPFGDMPTGGDTLYWDGNTEGLVSGSGIADGEKINAYYKISDAVPTKNDFANGFTIALKNPLDGTDVNVEISASDAQSSFSDDGFAILADGYFAIIPLGGYIFSFNGLEITCPEPGVYHITPMMVSGVANTLTIPGYTGFPVTKKMDEKYLPGAVILYVDAENYLYATSDTSDTSKRMTRAELWNIFYNGMSIYTVAGEGMYAICVACAFTETYGFVANEAIGMGYTAEYTAS